MYKQRERKKDVMKYPKTVRRKRSEKGVALLIALFALLLISAVGLALVAASGSETSLAGNYRNSSGAFHASMAGVEEGGVRRLPSNPNYFGAFVAPAGAPLALGQARYILNPAPGEAAGNILTKYPDTLYPTEFAGTAFTPPATQTTASMFSGAANPGPLYKWVRLNAVTEKSLGVNVGNHALPLDSTTPLYFDGGNLNLAGSGAQALEVTSLAMLPNGSRKMLQYVVAPQAPIQVDAAIHTKLADVMGDALNVTGLTDPVCAMPSTYGVKSGNSITIPGSGNVTGAPGDILPNSLFPYNVPALIGALTSSSTPIDVPVTGVTGSGTPKVYSGAHPTLGVAPTVTYNGSGAIPAGGITAPGTPATYLSPGNLTIGTPSIGGATPSGQGVLLVNGNLTVDITNGFNYFGLILVTGNVTFVANKNAGAMANVHGTIIAAGGVNGTSLTNLDGRVFIHQHACV